MIDFKLDKNVYYCKEANQFPVKQIMIAGHKNIGTGHFGPTRSGSFFPRV